MVNVVFWDGDDCSQVYEKLFIRKASYCININQAVMPSVGGPGGPNFDRPVNPISTRGGRGGGQIMLATLLFAP